MNHCRMAQHFKYDAGDWLPIVCGWCAGTTRSGCRCSIKSAAEAKRARKNAQRLARASDACAPEALR